MPSRCIPETCPLARFYDGGGDVSGGNIWEKCYVLQPGAFQNCRPGTNHFAHSGRPADAARLAEYEAGPTKGLGEEILKAFAAIVPPDADASAVSDAIVQVVNTPFGKRPFRVYVDPTQDGADVAFAVMDRVRAEMLHRVGFSDLLKPHQTKAE